MAEKLDRRRLAVRTGDDDHLVGHEPPPDLELADDTPPDPPSGDDHRRLLRDPGALHDGLGGDKQLHPVRAAMDLDALALERGPDVVGDLGRIAGDDLAA